MLPTIAVADTTVRATRLARMALVIAALHASAPAMAGGPVVAAAASARFALEDVVADFHRHTGKRVRLTLGSSGNLARQIREGAPYEVFLSADPRYVQALARDGFARDDGKNYLSGRLAIFVPLGSPLAADGSLEDLRLALADGRLKRFVIANPEHAPYGQRAEQALRRTGLWDAIAPHLVFGENVGQAAQFAVSGNVQGGIVAFALTRVPAVAARGSAGLIPGRWHDPLHHRAVLLTRAGPVAQQFYDYLDSDSARNTFRRHGFGLPGESD